MHYALPAFGAWLCFAIALGPWISAAIVGATVALALFNRTRA